MLHSNIDGEGPRDFDLDIAGPDRFRNRTLEELLGPLDDGMFGVNDSTAGQSRGISFASGGSMGESVHGRSASTTSIGN
jgi:hypothetical protein